MVEGGNYLDIRFQDQPRYKKPIGMYWMQAASVKLLNLPEEIWAYRIPSLLGAIISVLLLFYFGQFIFDRKIAFLASVLLGSSILLVTEAHMAKTDAFLLATVIAAQGSLALIYLKKNQGLKPALIFWIAQGVGILVKGPITPMLSLFSILTLLIVDLFTKNKPKWISNLRPLMGIPLALLISLPWFISIHTISKGTFWQESVGHDMLGKLLDGQESHGFPPGYYLLLLLFTFFPGSLFLIKSLPTIWRSKRFPEIKFLLSWLIPMWIFFEAIPTKLPHYVLPMYPALALLCAFCIQGIQRRLKTLIGGVTILYFIILQIVLPNIKPVWTSVLIKKEIDKNIGNPNPPIASAGYHEPSLVFLLGKGTTLLSGREAGTFLLDHPDGVAIITKEQEESFWEIAKRANHPIKTVSSLRGFNYSKGKWLDINIYAND